MYSAAAILIALALNILSLIYRFFPPRRINKWYGYHMASSMKNDETWREANNFAARMMTLLSIIFMAVALISNTSPDFGARELTLYAMVMVFSCCGLYFITEMHMRHVFDDNGIRKMKE